MSRGMFPRISQRGVVKHNGQPADFLSREKSLREPRMQRGGLEAARETQAQGKRNVCTFLVTTWIEVDKIPPSKAMEKRKGKRFTVKGRGQ